MSTTQASGVRIVRWLVGITLASTAVLITWVFPVWQWAPSLLEWTRGAGAIGLLVYSAAFVICTMLFVPGALMLSLAGLLYGPVWGTVFGLASATLAAGFAFIAGRFLVRDWVGRRIARDTRFRAIDRAIGERGFKVVVLLRLSPLVPYNLANYVLGATRVALLDFLLGSGIGKLPGAALYAYLGSTIGNLDGLREIERTEASRIFYWIGLAISLLVSIWLTRMARTALKNELPEIEGR